MTTSVQGRRLWQRIISGAVVAIAAILCMAGSGTAQLQGLEDGNWSYLGGAAGHSRYSPLNQINASNFEDLEVAWIWRGDNFGGGVEFTMRSTPSQVNGVLYTVVGQRRQVVAIDAATGETLWTFREPETTRYLRSPRSDFGKGVAYGEVEGRGVIYISTPGFFLWALDAATGRPLENWGRRVSLEAFPESGVVDMLPDLVGDWGPWQDFVAQGGTYDPDHGIPRELGMITASAPPIVVNGTVVVPTSHQPSYAQSRIENVPGDIQGYDAATGERLWKFHIIPRPGEVGHDTWENDAWQYTGDISSWAPVSADPELGLVYIVTNSPTVQDFTGHRPGNNLFANSVIALDVQTGERKWHFQMVHNDRWNNDIPTAPMLIDVTVDGREIPALIQYTKMGLIFAFNRETGEPIWPVEERPVLQSEVPGEWSPPTQPFPTLPEPQDPIVMTGLTEDFVIDFTPELKQQALDILSDFQVTNLYAPTLPENHTNDYFANVSCSSGVNIPHPPVADPTTGITYSTHTRGCRASGLVMPGELLDVDNPEYASYSPEGWRGRERRTPTTGTTVAEFMLGPGVGLPRIEGLPLWKPPYGNMLTAHDMNTGRRLWSLPVGHTPENIRNNPLLAGRDINTGGTGLGILMVMGDLLVQAQEDLRGEAELSEDGMPLLHARDKRTGEILSSVEVPVPGGYGMSSWMLDGKQYILMQAASYRRGHPGALVALTLP